MTFTTVNNPGESQSARMQMKSNGEGDAESYYGCKISVLNPHEHGNSTHISLTHSLLDSKGEASDVRTHEVIANW